MNAKITDITPLYLSRIITENRKNTRNFWYRPPKMVMPIVEPSNDDNADLIEDLNDKGFPEYIVIVDDIINYFGYEFIDNCDDASDMINIGGGDVPDYKNRKWTIHVLVDDNCEMAKKYSGDEFGFIRLFSLILACHEEENGQFSIDVHAICLNAKLAVEKFDLTVPNIDYDNKIIDYDNDPIENDTECCVCMISRGPMIETPCNHKFHLQCLKCCPNFICPLCRTNIKDFLKKHVESDEIENRTQIQNNEKEFENLCSAIDETEIENMSEINFVRLCMETLKLNNGNVIAYNDIIFDMNSNASQLFVQISHKLSLKEKGVFVYMYDSPIEFITQMRDPYSKSEVVWLPLSYFEETMIYDIIQNRVNRVRNTEEEYVVAIMIGNVINAHIINKNAHSGEFAARRHQRDILNSMIKCIRCKCSGTNSSDPNREYTWAKTTLAKLVKKNENNRRKRVNRRRGRKN